MDAVGIQARNMMMSEFNDSAVLEFAHEYA